MQLFKIFFSYKSVELELTAVIAFLAGTQNLDYLPKQSISKKVQQSQALVYHSFKDMKTKNRKSCFCLVMCNVCYSFPSLV